MPTAVDQALTEIGDKLEEIGPQLEGLRDFYRLNLQEDAQREIASSMSQYERREALLLAAQSALTALVADGHPDLGAREIEQLAYADLQANAATIEAALAQFTPHAAAASLRTSAGAAQKKT